MSKSDVIYLIPPFPKLSETLPLGGGYLCAALRDNGIGVRVIDRHNDQNRIQDMVDDVLALEPGVVGMSANTPQFVSVTTTAVLIKKANPGIKIIIGGPHITAMGIEALRECPAAVGVNGEADLIFAPLVKSLIHGDEKHKKLPGVIFQEHGQWTANPPGELADVNKLPFPAWEYFDVESYQGFPPVGGKRGRRSFPMATSRGCPYRCSFCADAGMGRKFRARSVESVIAEIEWLRDRFGMDEFYVHDDNFAQDVNRAKAVCRELIQRKINIPFRLPLGIRVNTMDRELVGLLKAAGCYQMGIGIESFDPGILELAGKPIAREKVHAILDWTKEYGLYTFGYFILGLPGSNWNTETATIDEAARSNLTFAHFSVAVPYPGSRLFDQNKDRLPRHWDQYFHFKAIYPLGGLSNRQLKTLMRRAVLKFYFRPGRFKALLSYFRFRDLRSVLKVLFAYFYR